MGKMTREHPIEASMIKDIVRQYIVDTLLLGDGSNFTDAASLLDTGILDSTGAMELVAFLEETFGISIGDSEIIADNLDSVDRIGALIERKCTNLSPSA